MCEALTPEERQSLHERWVDATGTGFYSMGDFYASRSEHAEDDVRRLLAALAQAERERDAAREALRDSMECHAINVHLDRGLYSGTPDAEPPGAIYAYAGKAWWELPDAAKADCRRLIATCYPAWVAAAAPPPEEEASRE